MSDRSKSNILKAALFATGLAGIVAEYILSTLATYFLGNTILQWTMVLSLMLFSMGLGSRLSRNIEKNVLETFIIIEFALSILTSVCALATYVAMAFTNEIGIIIYAFSIAIGILIGMEIPLVTRINDQYESLRTNIAGVMEKDYYGSLLGGIFFAFVGLPYLGLTYTPFILGGVNFVVALLLYYKLNSLVGLKFRKGLNAAALFVFALLGTALAFSEPIVLFGEQNRYTDKVIFSKTTPYQQITVTQWREDYWLFLNASKQLCTFDEWLYHEPLVHPVMGLSKQPKSVLVVGAGDGCAVREVLKYPGVEKITLVDLDKEMTEIGKNHPIFRKMNQDSYHSHKLTVINADAFIYMRDSKEFYDVIIADFPDPNSVDLARLYSTEFYTLCHKRLRHDGVIVTQSASPYYTPLVYKSVELSMIAGGFNTQAIHNHVFSFGEWSWVIGAKNIPAENIKPILQAMDFKGLPVRWINKEAMMMMTSFGQGFEHGQKVRPNSLQDPVIFNYYKDGNWGIYL